MHSRISLGQLILLGWRERCRLCLHLGAHLKAKANLMTSLKHRHCRKYIK